MRPRTRQRGLPADVLDGADRGGAGGRRLPGIAAFESAAAHVRTSDLPARRRCRLRVSPPTGRPCSSARSGPTSRPISFRCGREAANRGRWICRRAEFFPSVPPARWRSCWSAATGTAGHSGAGAVFGRSAARYSGKRERCGLVAGRREPGGVAYGGRPQSDRVSDWNGAAAKATDARR